MLLNIVLIQSERLERSWTPSEYPEIYPFKLWHLLLAIKLPCISAGHTRSCCTAKDRQSNTETHAVSEKWMCHFYFYFVWRPNPQVKNFSHWTAQLLPLILLSDRAFWYFSHLMEKRWTVKGTLPYPTCNNSNAFRCLPPAELNWPC